ncbi:hypothetical protein K1T71_005506 [Dendrolimus kikuchii]|uniref:Uncharacterized protein n=1 Tax=Dendrolimus kikuchii TaxID=765133 RepID=A0ACC1D4J2_9NEOP|nr:hypothetical protein K1T71_005506 [Dendrolimus kikuchii]
MSSLISCEKFVAVTKGLHIDFYDNIAHSIFTVTPSSQLQENDQITDIAVSSDCKYFAVITSTSKQLITYEVATLKEQNSFSLPRSASKVRFTVDNMQLLIADKSGDVLIYDVNGKEGGKKLLGHLSLLLDILQTPDKKYIITTDRDEKIRVTCYPNTYTIETYCLGHKEFVNHIEILPHNENFLSSTSGDGTIKIWDYIKGKISYTIDTYVDVNDHDLKEKFIKVMDAEGVEVTTLPIVHYSVTKINESSSLLAVTVHSFNIILLYTVHTVDNVFSHKVERLNWKNFPAAINFQDSFLFIYDNVDCNLIKYNVVKKDENVSLELLNKTTMFENVSNGLTSNISNSFDSIRVLYKRKFDNVQEYQERKKQRLEKSLE